MLEDIKLSIRGQSRNYGSGESSFYLERLNSGSEFGAMRTKSQNRIGRDGSEVQVGGAKLGTVLRT